mgnify:CR=1 FL=1
MSSILSQHENEKRFIWLIKSAYLYIRTEDDTILMPIKINLTPLSKLVSIQLQHLLLLTKYCQNPTTIIHNLL